MCSLQYNRKWTSGNDDIVKDTILMQKIIIMMLISKHYLTLFLEWVSFDKFTDIKQISEVSVFCKFAML
jgi:hypothetical protein